MIAAADEGQNGGHDGAHARGEDDGVLGVLELCKAPLRHLFRGVAVAAVFVAELAPLGVGLDLLGVLECKRRSLHDGRGDRVGVALAVFAGVNRAGRKSEWGFRRFGFACLAHYLSLPGPFTARFGPSKYHAATEMCSKDLVRIRCGERLADPWFCGSGARARPQKIGSKQVGQAASLSAPAQSHRRVAGNCSSGGTGWKPVLRAARIHVDVRKGCGRKQGEKKQLRRRAGSGVTTPNFRPPEERLFLWGDARSRLAGGNVHRKSKGLPLCRVSSSLLPAVSIPCIHCQYRPQSDYSLVLS